MHTEPPGLVRSSADDRAIALPSNDHGLAAQLRVIALLDRSIKRVHVGMDDFSQDLTPKTRSWFPAGRIRVTPIRQFRYSSVQTQAIDRRILRHRQRSRLGASLQHCTVSAR